MWAIKETLIRPAQFSPLARVVIFAAPFAIVVTVARSAALLLAPILIAAFVAAVAARPLTWMRRRGVPNRGGSAPGAAIFLDVGGLVILTMTGALERIRDSLPGHQKRFILLDDQFGLWLEQLELAGSREATPDVLDPASAIRILLGRTGDIDEATEDRAQPARTPGPVADPTIRE